jgi:uncharacterized protein YraI
METKFGFTLLTTAEFGSWLKLQVVSRAINVIQLHHTWLPNYGNFNGNNHFEKLQGMRSSHLARGFSDIAQNITIFPDGKIGIGRSLNTIPAGIYGQNGKGICIENLGDFDLGKDQMTPAHRDAIIQVTAHLCARFGLLPDTNTVVYHHWYDLKTGQRTNGSGNTKTCPGTGFFGGNTVAAAQQNLIPQVLAFFETLRKPSTTIPAVIAHGVVISSGNLNVRKGPGVSSEKTGSLASGSEVQIFEEKAEWMCIGENAWVSSRFISKVQHGAINVESAGVYAGPGGTYNLLNTLTSGEEVLVYTTANGWSRIDFIDKWVKSSLITLK